jgi:hypothetical protein
MNHAKSWYHGKINEIRQKCQILAEIKFWLLRFHKDAQAGGRRRLPRRAFALPKEANVEDRNALVEREKIDDELREPFTTARL